MTVRPASPPPAAALIEPVNDTSVATHDQIRAASLRTASGPATLFWSALLFSICAGIGMTETEAHSHSVLFAAYMLAALPLLVLVLRARSGFPILGLRDGSRGSVIRARLLGLIAPGLLAVAGLPLPGSGLPGAMVAIQAVASVLILISMLWLQLRITDAVAQSNGERNAAD